MDITLFRNGRIPGQQGITGLMSDTESSQVASKHGRPKKHKSNNETTTRSVPYTISETAALNKTCYGHLFRLQLAIFSVGKGDIICQSEILDC